MRGQNMLVVLYVEGFKSIYDAVSVPFFHSCIIYEYADRYIYKLYMCMNIDLQCV